MEHSRCIAKTPILELGNPSKDEREFNSVGENLSIVGPHI